VDRYLDGGGPRDSLGEFFDWLAPRHVIRAFRAAGGRLHVGTPEALREADALLRREPVVPGSGPPETAC
jgi:hypothetical protein